MNAAFQQAELGRRAGAIAAVVLYLAACAIAFRSGSPASIWAAVALTLAPLALYLTVFHPWLFPYTLYAGLIPFDNILLAGGTETVTKLLGLAAAAALVLYCIRKRSIVPLPPTILPLAAMVGWMALSALWAADQKWSMDFLPTYADLAVLYLAVILTPITWNHYRFILGAVVAGNLICALIGAHAFYANPALADQSLAAQRLVLTLGHNSIDPNQFADALLIPGAVVLMFVLRTRSKLAFAAGLGGLSIILAAISLSGSREALIGLIAIVGYFALRSPYRLKIAIGTGVALAVFTSVHSSLWLRFSTAMDTGGAGRTSIWAVGLEAFKHRWFAGYGIGNFPVAYDQYYLSVFQPYTNGWTSAPHNLIIGYLVEIGVVGVALIGWFLWSHIRVLHRIDKSHPLYDYRIMLEGALLGVLVVSMSIDLFRYKYAWLLFAMLVQLRSVAFTMAPTASERPQKRDTKARPLAPA